MADKIAAAGLGDAEDLLQEGFFGLLKAAEAYDPAPLSHPGKDLEVPALYIRLPEEDRRCSL